MASPYHDAIVQAFANAGAHPVNCNRGDLAIGYTHVHGPNKPPTNGPACLNCILADVEKTNGTVSLFKPIAAAMGALERETVPIAEHPLGYSRLPNYGNFGLGFDAATILRRWGSFNAFAKAVILIASHADIRRW